MCANWPHSQSNSSPLLPQLFLGMNCNIHFSFLDLFHLVCSALIYYMAKLLEHGSCVDFASMSFSCDVCSKICHTAHPQTIFCMHLVRSTFSLLFPYLILNPFAHEYKLSKIVRLTKCVETCSYLCTMTKSPGFSANCRTDFSRAEIL